MKRVLQLSSIGGGGCSGSTNIILNIYDDSTYDYVYEESEYGRETNNKTKSGKISRTQKLACNYIKSQFKLFCSNCVDNPGFLVARYKLIIEDEEIMFTKYDKCDDKLKECMNLLLNLLCEISQ